RPDVRALVPAHLCGLPRARLQAAGRGVPPAPRASLGAGPRADRPEPRARAPRRAPEPAAPLTRLDHRAVRGGDHRAADRDRLGHHPDQPPRALAVAPAHLQPVSARAGIVVTGTEVLSGRVSDRNGPWLSERLREIGVDHAETVVVGDRPVDMLEALRFLAG